MNRDTKAYGISKQHELSNELDPYMEELAILGFTIVPDALQKSELELARAKLSELYRKQEEQFGKDLLGKIGELNLVRCPLAYDHFFLQIAAHPKIIPLAERLVGQKVLLHLQNGILNMPGEVHHQSSWHRDLPYQDFVISQPIAVSALFCIDEFNQANGSTFLLPYSHRLDRFPSTLFVNKHQYPVEAPAGSVIVFDSMLFHRAGYNSSDGIRRGINHVYVAPILKQQIDLPAFLNGKYAEDDFFRRFLGYDTQPATSDREFKERRRRRLDIDLP